MLQESVACVQLGTQVPPEQNCWAPQTLPQLPQLRGSFRVLTQAPPQSVSPLPQQTELMQTPLQSFWPGGHVQTPPWQLFPPVQALPQLPQLALSVAVLTQVPLQSV